jgi:hypothetical protein
MSDGDGRAGGGAGGAGEGGEGGGTRLDVAPSPPPVLAATLALQANALAEESTFLNWFLTV